MDVSHARYRTTAGAASLIVGPALMSAGDLLHPAETHVAVDQIAIVAESMSRWYAAHLLLFLGMILLVPGLLVLTGAAMERRPAAGYVARLLVLASVGAFSAVLGFEMLIGRFLADGGDQQAATALLDTFQSPAIAAAIGPVLLAFFAGTALVVRAFASSGDPFRWPAAVLGLGALLILGEIVLADVRLSKIGNVLILLAGVAFARVLLRRPDASPR